MPDNDRNRQWSGLIGVLGILALVTAIEALLSRNYFMVVFLATAGSSLLIGGWITRRRIRQKLVTPQPRTK